MEKKRSYDKFWLSKDMENMGYMFEYSDMFAKELYNANANQFDKLKFADIFMRSRMRREMDTGHPWFLSEAAIDSFEKYISVDFNANVSEFYNVKPHVFRKNYLYWVGWAYAYIHYEADMYSSDIIERLPLSYMIEQYYTGHEMDISVFYDKIKRRLV